MRSASLECVTANVAASAEQMRVGKRMGTLRVTTLVRARFSTLIAERGMAVGGPTAPDIVLTVEDVARIDAAVADIHS